MKFKSQQIISLEFFHKKSELYGFININNRNCDIYWGINEGINNPVTVTIKVLDQNNRITVITDIFCV